MNSIALSLRNFALPVSAIGCVGLAVLLFGADVASASLAISFLLFVVAVIALWRIPELYPSLFVILLLVLWAGFFAIHGQKGFVTGKLDHYLMLLTAIIVFWLGQFSIKLARRPSKIWSLLLGMCLFYSIFAFFQNILTPDHILGFERPYHQDRLGGSFLSANTTATFFGMIVIAAFAYICRAWFKVSSRRNIGQSELVIDFVQKAALGLTTLLFAFSSLLMTASRAGIAIGLCALFMFVLWAFIQGTRSKGQSKRSFLTPLILGFVGFLVVFLTLWNLSGDQVSLRYNNVFVDYQSRQDMIVTSWKAFQYEPVFGHGLGHFNEAKLLGVDPATNYNVFHQNAAHNFYLQTLVQSGIVGLFAIIWIYIFIMAGIVRGILKGQRYRTYLVAVALMSFIICSHGLFDYALEIPGVMLFHALILGIGAGLARKPAEQ